MMSQSSFRVAREFVSAGGWQPLPERNAVLFQLRRDPELITGAVPVVFLHGIPTWSFLWRVVLNETGLERTAIAVDLPGFGLSDKSPRHSFRVAEIALTVERFLDETFGIDSPVHLVLHDFGGLVGAELVARNPERVRAMVITNTSFRPESWSGAGLLRVLSVPLLGEVSMMLARPWMLRVAMLPFFGDKTALTPECLAGYWYPFEGGFGSSLARLYQESVLDSDDFSRWRTVLVRFNGETLMLWGKRDPAFGTRDFDDVRSLLPESQVIEFRHAGHFLPEERPQAVGRAIRSFLRDQAGSVE